MMRLLCLPGGFQQKSKRSKGAHQNGSTGVKVKKIDEKNEILYLYYGGVILAGCNPGKRRNGTWQNKRGCPFGTASKIKIVFG